MGFSLCWNGVYPSVNNHLHTRSHIVWHTSSTPITLSTEPYCSSCVVAGLRYIWALHFSYATLHALLVITIALVVYLFLADCWEMQQHTPWLLNHRKSCFVSQLTVMGSEARLPCHVFVYVLSQFLQITSQKRALATRALIQSVGSPADLNPLTPQPNAWNVLP